MYKALQEQVKPQMLATLLVSLIILTLLTGYLYVLKKPLKDFNQAWNAQELLENELQTGVPLASQIDLFQQQITQLTQQLHGSNQKLPLNQMIVSVISQMDTIAAAHHVKLISVEPGDVEKIYIFQELPFNVVVVGKYVNLFDWLDQVGRDLGPIVIKNFELTPEPDSAMRRFTLTLVSYQFAEAS
jgi:Tfp pilus assembly protein PilO